jgi:hypothetical protein
MAALLHMCSRLLSAMGLPCPTAMASQAAWHLGYRLPASLSQNEFQKCGVGLGLYFEGIYDGKGRRHSHRLSVSEDAGNLRRARDGES